MKKFFKYASLVLGATVLFASCEKETAINDKAVADGEVLISIKATEGVDSKTYIDGTAVKWSASGEFLKVYEVKTPTEGEAVTTPKNSASGSTEDSGATMTFDVTMPEPGEGTFTFDYYAFYPASAYGSGSTVTNIAINTPSAQAPIATSFDPSADLLIARHISNGSSQATNLNMEFARMVAIAKMTIKNLESTDPVTKITFSAKEGENAIKLAGRTAFNLTDGSLVNTYGGNVGDTSIILDVEDLDTINGNADTEAGMTTYFTCYPFAINSSNPGSFKVIVETASQTFTKDVSVSSAKGLALNAGKASTFAIDMDGIVGEDKAVDLCYAYLEYSDVSSQLSNSYGNARVTKAHGDTWSMCAMDSNSSIALRNYANANDSYIKLPDFEDDIETVVVTLKNVTSSKAITLESSATNKGGTIASLATTDATVYTFDLSESVEHTAYFRSNGFQALVEKIEVFAGSDTRTVLDTPDNVSAVLNAEANNAIDVSWDAVDGAGSYLITLMDEDTNILTRVAASSPYTVTGLDHEMEYSIGVKALPEDYYVNKESAEADAGSVETGAGAVDYSTLETSNVTLSTTGGTNASEATVNGKTAIKAGTGSAAGVVVVNVPANTTNLHVHIAAWKGDTVVVGVTGASADPDELSLTANTGVANSTPFTLSDNPSDDPADYYFNIGLEGIDSDTDITFTATSGKRFVIWGVNAEAGTPATPTVATPTFSLVGSNVSIDCTTDGATIYYTTDGSVPNTSSSVYSAAVSILGSQQTLIKAFATKNDYEDSEVAAKTYYAVNVDATENGTVTAQPFAAEGDEISLTVTPDGGYQLDELSVVNDSSAAAVPVTNNTFTMPASPVTVSATFDTASYDFETIAELNSLASSGGEKTGYLTDAVVSYVPNTGNAIIKDATGSILLYKTSHGLLQGQTFTGELTVTITEYNGCSELTACDASFTGNQETVAPVTMTLAQLAGNLATYQNAYVKVDNLTVTAVNNKNITVTDDGGAHSYIVYSSPANATCSVDDVLSVVGTIAWYNSNDQIKVWDTNNITVTGSAPKAVTFTQPTGAAAEAGCSIAVTVGGSPHTSGNTVASETTVTLTATAGTDYEFTSWNVIGATVADASASTTTFTMGTSAVSISATFTSTGGGGGTEYTSTLTFTAKCNGSGTADDGASWTVTSDGTESNFDNTKGIHYGTNSAQVQYIRLTTSDIPGTISRVVVNASTASNVSATVSVTVGGSAFGGAAQSLTASAANYTFDGSDSGEIVVTVTKPNKAAKAIYVKSIVVTYTN